MYSVMHEQDGQTKLVKECQLREEAELALLRVLSDVLSNFDEYTVDDIGEICDRGEERYGRGRVYIDW